MKHSMPFIRLKYLAVRVLIAIVMASVEMIAGIIFVCKFNIEVLVPLLASSYWLDVLFKLIRDIFASCNHFIM